MILAGKWHDYGKAVAQGEELSPRLGDPGLLAFVAGSNTKFGFR